MHWLKRSVKRRDRLRSKPIVHTDPSNPNGILVPIAVSKIIKSISLIVVIECHVQNLANETPVWRDGPLRTQAGHPKVAGSTSEIELVQSLILLLLMLPPSTL
jgi:hypothetical protein